MLYSNVLYSTIIGASLSEPHINGTNVRQIYVYIYIICLRVVRPSPARRYIYCAQFAIYSNTSLEAA